MPVDFPLKHDVQTVYETLTDPDFLVDRCLALGELSAECEVEEEEGGATIITLVREIQRDLPRLLVKFFDPVQVMDMTETWIPTGKGWRGSWEMKVRGQPVTVGADFELVPAAGGCRYRVSHRANAKIPLAGKAVEKYILGETSGGARDELSYLGRYLDGD